MNVKQAKEIVGIPPHVKIVGAKAISSALASVKAEIIAARRAGNDDRAALLSEAKEVFKRQIKNHCPVCGEPIARGAKACVLHSKKRLPGPEASVPCKTHKASKRVDVSPEGGWLARYGFYTSPVQKAVRKWSVKIPTARINAYFPSVAAMMLHRNRPSLGYVGSNDWACVFELGLALDEVLQDKQSPESWLIRFPTWVATDGVQDGWAAIAERIRNAGGPSFKLDTLTQAAHRMRIVTPEHVRESARRSGVVA